MTMSLGAVEPPAATHELNTGVDECHDGEENADGSRGDVVRRHAALAQSHARVGETDADDEGQQGPGNHRTDGNAP